MLPLPLLTPITTTLVADPIHGLSYLPKQSSQKHANCWPPFDIRDPIIVGDDDRNPNKQLLATASRTNEIGLSQLQGPGVSILLEPLHSVWTLFLPADGAIRLDGDEHNWTCVHGQSITYLPAHSWRLTAMCGSNIGLHGTTEALLRRLLAMHGQDIPMTMHQRLNEPSVITLSEPQACQAYQQLVAALRMMEGILTTTGNAPHPCLNIDDLLLRSVALILCPEHDRSTQLQSGIMDNSDLQRTIKDLMDWMRANLHRPISLTEIEQRCHYGRRTLQMGFRQAVGCGPIQWLRRQRLQTAYQQLLDPSSDLNVTAVARQCGYLSLSSFSRDFNALYQCTPSSLRRRAG